MPSIPVDERRIGDRVGFLQELPAHREKALKRPPRPSKWGLGLLCEANACDTDQPKSRTPARAVLNSSLRGLASADARARGQRAARTRPTQARPRTRRAKRRVPTSYIGHESWEINA